MRAKLQSKYPRIVHQLADSSRSRADLEPAAGQNYIFDGPFVWISIGSIMKKATLSEPGYSVTESRRDTWETRGWVCEVIITFYTKKSDVCRQ